jgi:hypothetical protein
MIHASQSHDRLKTEQTVRIGDNADEHDYSPTLMRVRGSR